MPDRGVCPFCGVGCTLRDVDGNGRGVAGAVNARGELCPKGVAAYDHLDHPDRLTTPLVREDGDLVPTTWDEALARAAAGIRAAVDDDPDAFCAFASSSTTNETNYLVGKLARALGTNNVDNCARLCHASTVAAMGARFGAGAATNSLADLRETDCLLVAGANPAEQHPVAFTSYLYPAVTDGADLVVLDPRETATASRATHHLPVRPGRDDALLGAVCAVVLDENLADDEFLSARATGVERFREWVSGIDVAALCERAGVPEPAVRDAARAYASADRAAIVTGMGLSQHAHGTRTVHALLNLALLTGNVGREGTGVSPLRGKNNVQGAGDVGALPDTLPGYRPVTDADARAACADVWGFDPPADPGLTEVEATHAFGDGVRAALVVGENPAATEPNAGRVAREFDALDTLVVVDVFPTQTTAHADVVLPAAAWAEEAGTFTNLDRQVQRTAATHDPPGDARPDREVVSALARCLGLDFDYPDAAAVFDELTRVLPQYAGMSYDGIGDGSQRWPLREGDTEGSRVLHRDAFATPDGRAELVPVDPTDPAEAVGPDELALTTGRVLQHYNSGVVTRRSDRLVRLRSADALQIHPADARPRGIRDGDRVVVENDRGRVEVPCAVTPGVREGVVFLTFHFADPLTNALTGDALDPEAKIPEYKHTPVRVRPA